MTRGWSSQSLRAMGWAIAAYFAAMVISSVALSGLTRLYLGVRGWDDAQIHDFLTRQFQSYPQMVLAILPGVSAAGAAGYTVANRVTALEYWHALGIALLTALIFTGPVMARLPLWYTLMTVTLSVVAALFGASFPKRYRMTSNP